MILPFYRCSGRPEQLDSLLCPDALGLDEDLGRVATQGSYLVEEACLRLALDHQRIHLDLNELTRCVLFEN